MAYPFGPNYHIFDKPNWFPNQPIPVNHYYLDNQNMNHQIIQNYNNGVPQLKTYTNINHHQNQKVNLPNKNSPPDYSQNKRYNSPGKIHEQIKSPKIQYNQGNYQLMNNQKT